MQNIYKREKQIPRHKIDGLITDKQADVLGASLSTTSASKPDSQNVSLSYLNHMGGGGGR